MQAPPDPLARHCGCTAKTIACAGSFDQRRVDILPGTHSCHHQSHRKDSASAIRTYNCLRGWTSSVAHATFQFPGELYSSRSILQSAFTRNNVVFKVHGRVTLLHPDPKYTAPCPCRQSQQKLELRMSDGTEENNKKARRLRLFFIGGGGVMQHFDLTRPSSHARYYEVDSLPTCVPHTRTRHISV